LKAASDLSPKHVKDSNYYGVAMIYYKKASKSHHSSNSIYKSYKWDPELNRNIARKKEICLSF
jgi:hypothetical protein